MSDNTNKQHLDSSTDPRKISGEEQINEEKVHTLRTRTTEAEGS